MQHFFSIEQQIRGLEDQYSNELSKVRFWDFNPNLNGSAILPGYSIMTTAYAIELLNRPDDEKLKNAFEFSLAHERGHLHHPKHPMQDLLKGKVSHWIDEVLSDLWGFQYVMNQHNWSFDETFAQYEAAINSKHDYRVSMNLNSKNNLDEDDSKHPSWDRRKGYIQEVNNLQKEGIDEAAAIQIVLEKVIKDYHNRPKKKNKK